MEWFLLPAMIFLIKTFIDLLKYIRAHNYNAALTIGVVLVAGVFVMLLVAQTNFADSFEIADMALSDLNIPSQILIGLTLGSTGAFANDFLAAVDQTRTSRTPSLFTESEINND